MSKPLSERLRKEAEPFAYDNSAGYELLIETADLIDALVEALERQTDNMAFLLNHASIPDQWAFKLNTELEIDRATLARAKGESHG